MKSMTGFAFIDANYKNYTFSFTIKSYNSKYFEYVVFSPENFDSIKNDICKKIENRYSSGKIEFKFSIKLSNTNLENQDILFLDAFNTLNSLRQNILENTGNDLGKVSVSDVIDYVSNFKKQSEKLEVSNEILDFINPILDKLFTAFDNEKQSEGNRLQIDILNNLDIIKCNFNRIKELESNIESKLKETFFNRVKEINYEGAINQENNISSLFAFYMTKYTINEEIVRFLSHLDAVFELIENSKMNDNLKIGKKLDFYCQELNREINTISSKNFLLKLPHFVVNIKNSIENLREQSKNIE